MQLGNEYFTKTYKWVLIIPFNLETVGVELILQRRTTRSKIHIRVYLITTLQLAPNTRHWDWFWFRRYLLKMGSSAEDDSLDVHNLGFSLPNVRCVVARSIIELNFRRFKELRVLVIMSLLS